MRLIEFRAENFARLKAVEIRPDGDIIPITGQNGQGKTSLLRAIWALINGRAVAPAVAIREGEEEAALYGDLGAYKITRTIKRDQEGAEEWALKVVAADGTRITKAPQEVINAFRGDIGFDPLGWCRLPAKDQAAALRSLVKGFDFEEAAENRAAAFAERTTANRKAKDAQSAADKVVLPAGSCPQPIDVSQKLAELREADRVNTANRLDRQDRPASQRAIDNMLDKAEQLRAQAATLEKNAAEAQKELDARPPLAADIDTAPIQAAIGQAQQIDEIRAAFMRRQTFQEEAKAAQADSDRLTQEIADIDAAREEAIAKAKLPVKGLSLGEDAVLLNGLPLAQAGTAEKIETALALAMAKNPDLKVILIDEGSELDSSAMAFVAKLAAKHDFQVWIARVDETRQVGFTIEDGRVAT